MGTTALLVAILTTVVLIEPSERSCVRGAALTLYVDAREVSEHQISEADSLIDAVRVIECATERTQCINAGVLVYPTWEFPDGSRHEGLLEREAIVSLAGCGSS